MNSAVPSSVPATLVSALLAASAFPPFRFTPGLFTAYLLLALVLERTVRAEAPARTSFRLGALWGAVCWAALLPWTWAALARTPLLGLLAYGALVAAFSVAHGLMAGSIVWLRRSWRVPLVLAFPVGWIAGEWLRGHLGPFAFPWLPLAAGLGEWPRPLGLAGWVGASGLGFWLLVPQAWIASRFVERTPRPPGRAARPRLSAALVVGWVALPFVLPRVEAPSEAQRRVLVLQPNVAAFGEPAATARAVLAWVGEQVAGGANRASARYDLILLPEGAIPIDVARSPGIVDALATLSRGLGAPIMFGGWARAPSDREGTVSNTVFVVDEGGLRDRVYRKRRLVPATEWIPFGIGGRGVVPGREPGVFEVAGVRWGVLICYESIFSAAGRDLGRAGADVILNLSNDAWYGRPGAGRLGLEQHPAHVTLRAVETGLPVLRVANTGPSFLADPRGRVFDRTPLGAAAVQEVTVPVDAGVTTLFARTGDLIGPASVGFLLLLALVKRLDGGKNRLRRG